MNIGKISQPTNYVDNARLRTEILNKQPHVGSSEGEAQQGSQAQVAEELHFENQRNSEELIKRSLEEANKSLAKVDRYIEREIHDKTKAIIYKIKDRRTGEVIAEFPPKKIQDMIAKMWEFAGMFVDERA